MAEFGTDYSNMTYGGLSLEEWFQLLADRECQGGENRK